MNFLNPIYRSFEPPAVCNNPLELFNHIWMEGGCFNPDGTEHYLKNYQPKKDTEGKQKAKEYWSCNFVGNRTYESNKFFFEKIRQDFPNEVEKLRKKIWKKHVVKMAEDDLRLSYSSKDTSPEIPDDFIDLESYRKVESVDCWIVPNYWNDDAWESRPTKTVIEKFPEASEEIQWAKRYILGQVSAEERENIPEKYLPQVKRFRVLLWERHLKCVELKDHNKKEQEDVQKDLQKQHEAHMRKSNQRFFIVATIIIATLAGFFFSRCGRRSLNFPTFKSLIGVSFFKSMTSLSEGIPKSLQANGQAFCTCGGGHFYCSVENAKPHIKQAKL